MRWTEDDLATLQAAYTDRTKPVRLDPVAAAVGRDKANVCRKARELGLTNQRRPKKEERQTPDPKKFGSDAERNTATGVRVRAWIAENGHPRGALGIKHGPETRKVLGQKSRAAWADPKSGLNSERARQARSDNMLKRVQAGQMNQRYSRTRGGRREDLGDTYFRSSWEANYARYLNYLKGRGEIVDWAYEPKTFVFEKIKRGTRAYTPDFRVDLTGGGYEWHEVKGWMDAKSKTRLDRMRRYYPGEKLLLVDAAWFKSANRTLPGIIPNWETAKARP